MTTKNRIRPAARIFVGKIRVRITATNPRIDLRITEAQRKVLAKQITQTECSHSCKIAEDVRSALLINGVVAGRHRYVLNTKLAVRFHADAEGKSVLQFSLIDVKDGSRYTLEWREARRVDALPDCLAEVAVAHDEFLPIKARTVVIDLGKAVVWETGNKDGKGGASKDSRRNHDTNKKGDSYSRKYRHTHQRHCRVDLARHKAELQNQDAPKCNNAPSA